MAGVGFVLGVDFGTSNTVAMLRWPDGRSKPLLFDGTPLLPSAVFAPAEGPLSVGRDALHHGRHRPDGLEPNPKRRIDEGAVLLGPREVSVVELVGAVLARVGHEAARVAGRTPQTLVVSHPAGWGPVRRLALTDSAGAAGLPAPVFLAEPVAAALYFTSVLGGSVPPGQALLVYDLGAGTFDVSVLRAGAPFEVLGSDGLDDVGGLDFDAAVVGWLKPHYDGDAWERLSRPATADDSRLRLALWREARVAKEMLSRAPSVLLRPPLLDDEVLLTLEEFERIASPLIDRTVRSAVSLTRYCGVTAGQVLLVGGSSRVPLVATALHRAFGLPPTVTEQPETVVAEGCMFAVPVHGGAMSIAPVSAAPVSAAPVSGSPVSASPYQVGLTPVSGPPVSGPPVSSPFGWSPQPVSGQPASVPAQRRPEEAETEQLPALSPAMLQGASAYAGGSGLYGAGSYGNGSAGTGLLDGGGSDSGPDSSPGSGSFHTPVHDPRRTAPLPQAEIVVEPPPVRRSRADRIVLTALAVLTVLAVFLAGAAVNGVFAGGDPRGPGQAATSSAPQPDTSAVATPATTPPPAFPTAWKMAYADSLSSAQGPWTPSNDNDDKAQCAFRNGRLEATLQTTNIWRCAGRPDLEIDFALKVDVYLLNTDSCAGVWFRRNAQNSAGYLLSICADRTSLYYHRVNGDLAEFADLGSWRIAADERVRLGLVVQGSIIRIFRDDVYVNEFTDTAYPAGRTSLGVVVPHGKPKDGRVAFRDIEMRRQ